MSIGQFLKRTLWSNEETLSCPEIEIENVDQAFYNRLLASASSAGASFEGTTARFKGCVFIWNYDAASSMLRVTPTHVPLFTCGTVKTHILNLVEQARNAI